MNLVLPVWQVTSGGRRHVGEAVLQDTGLTLTIESLPELSPVTMPPVPYWFRQAQKRQRPLTPWERQSLIALQQQMQLTQQELEKRRQPVSDRPGEEALRAAVHLCVDLAPGVGLKLERLAQGAHESSLIAVASDPPTSHIWIEGRPDLRAIRHLHLALDVAPPSNRIHVRPARPDDPVTPRLVPRPEALPTTVLERQASAEHARRN